MEITDCPSHKFRTVTVRLSFCFISFYYLQYNVLIIYTFLWVQFKLSSASSEWNWVSSTQKSGSVIIKKVITFYYCFFIITIT